MWLWRPLGTAIIEIQSNLAGCLGAVQQWGWRCLNHSRTCMFLCATAWCSPRAGAGAGAPLAKESWRMAGQLLSTPCAMSCLTNLSCWRGSVIKQNIQKAFLWLPRGKELNGLQPRAALSLGGKLDRRRLCGWRAEGAKGGAETHGKPTGAGQHRKLWTYSQKRLLQFAQ